MVSDRIRSKVRRKRKPSLSDSNCDCFKFTLEHMDPYASNSNSAFDYAPSRNQP